MHPARPEKNRRRLAWIAMVTLCTVVLSGCSAYGRLLEWTSAEWIYTPSDEPGFSSDFLTESGQRILLSDWADTESQRKVTIQISGYVPRTEQETSQQPQEATEPATNPATDVWDDGEISITLDALAAEHLAVSAQTESNAVTVLFQRRTDAPGLSQATELTAQILWNGLSGTVCTRMLPYGQLAEQQPPEEQPTRQVVTGLELLKVHDTVNASKPVCYVKLNPQTLSDFTLRFTYEEQALPLVRWSMDGGKTYSLLYDSHQLNISWPYPEDWDGLVLLDFSYALQSGQRPTVNVMATDYQAMEFIPVLQELPTAKKLILKATALPHTMQMEPRWGAAQLQLQPIQHLIVDETGALTYGAYPTLSATVTTKGIQVKSSAGLPEPGSYRLVLQWVWEELIIEEQTLDFFINTN